MISISEPKIQVYGDVCIVYSDISERDKVFRLWFSTSIENKEYIITKRADAFLVSTLFYALKKGQDIKVNALVSEKLYYNITTYFMDTLCKMNSEYKRINIICKTDTKRENVYNGVGTGISCGVDSFCTLYQHTLEKCPPGYRITHLTFFNVGASGDYGGDAARDLYTERKDFVQGFCSRSAFPLIDLDSNLSEFLNMSFLQTHTFRNCIAVLIFQKLFSRYYYSSATTISEFKLDYKLAAKYDIFTLSMLSTEDTEFYSSGSTFTRVEKTRLISEYVPSYKFLNVCVYEKDNCTICYKCKRTLLTLDFLGVLDKYRESFDLELYRKKRVRFIGDMLANKNKDKYLKEIYILARQNKIKIPLLSRLYALLSMKWLYNEISIRISDKHKKKIVELFKRLRIAKHLASSTNY